KRLVAFTGCQCDTRLERRAAPTRHCRCPCGLHLPGHSPEPPHRLKSEPTSNINVLVQISGSSSKFLNDNFHEPIHAGTHRPRPIDLQARLRTTISSSGIGTRRT